MDKKTINSIIRQTAAMVLENAAFVFVDEDIGNTDISGYSFIGGKINFDGKYCGNVSIWMASETIDSIARNLLSIDDDDKVSVKQRDDALKEMLNMITGNLLTSLYDEQLVFNLDIPQLLKEKLNTDELPEYSVTLYSESVPVIIALDVV